MGDEILKNKILLILSLFLLTNLSAIANGDIKNKTKEYDKLFQQIGEKRIGVSNKKINEIQNPFIMANKKNIVVDGNITTTHKIVYDLNAIFNDKAKINGEWYKLNNQIGDFKLVKIGSKSVIIKGEHSKKELFIRKSDVSKIKFSSK